MVSAVNLEKILENNSLSEVLVQESLSTATDKAMKSDPVKGKISICCIPDSRSTERGTFRANERDVGRLCGTIWLRPAARHAPMKQKGEQPEERGQKQR